MGNGKTYKNRRKREVKWTNTNAYADLLTI